MTESMPDPLTAHIAGSDDDVTRQIVRIWKELLSLDSVGFDQNYFDLGGDSSVAVQMFTQIEKIFKVKLPLATLYEAPTIEELARILRGDSWPRYRRQLEGN